jgi:hypothetical protein
MHCNRVQKYISHQCELGTLGNESSKQKRTKPNGTRRQTEKPN